MSEPNVDLSTKNLMCHNIGTIQCDTDPVKLFFKDETILTIFPTEQEAIRYKEKNPGENVSFETDYRVDLKDLIGITCQDFYISFYALPEDEIDSYHTDPEEKWFHALYHFINYEVSGWVGVKEHNELTFYDNIFSDDD